MRLAAGQTGPDTAPTPGTFNFWFSSRSALTPVSGSSTRGSFRVFGSQTLASGPTLTLSFADGFPFTTWQGFVEVSDLPFSSRGATLTAGDVLVQSSAPAGLDIPGREASFLLTGVSLSVGAEESHLHLAAGRAKYFSAPGSDRDAPEPGVLAVRHEGRYRWGWLDLSVTGLEDALNVESGEEMGDVAVATVGARRRLGGRMVGFVEGLGASSSALAVRTGVQGEAAALDFCASAYHFGSEFPYLYPLFRPGESGVDASAVWRAAEATTVTGSLNWYEQSIERHRRDVRGTLGISHRLGSNRPFFSLTYGRNETIWEAISIAPGIENPHRLSLTTGWSTQFELVQLSAEHLWGGERALSQIWLVARRVVGPSLIVNASAVAERRESNGVSAEVTADFPLRGRYSAITGVGGVWREVQAGDLVDAYAIGGIRRELAGRGLYLQLRGQWAFAVGSARANVARSEVIVDLGYALGWRRLEQVMSALGISPPGVAVGTVEGLVTRGDQPAAGVRVLVNDDRRTTTGRDGRYRIRGVPVGAASVTLDSGTLRPREAGVGGSSRLLEVAAGGINRADFQLSVFSYFQGAVVRCEGDRVLPVAGAVVRLVSSTAELAATTSGSGGFVFDEVPPGVYAFAIDVSGVVPPLPAVEVPLQEIDLTEDRAGFVVRLECP